MPHLNLASGVPTVVASGALVGATDFREFPVGVGLPAGITPFGSLTSIPDPLLVEIGNDGFPNEVSEEGHHFAMTGRGGERWGYGLDSFFGQMDRGELRAIVRMDYRGGFEDFPIGAAAGMQGADDTGWRAWLGTQFLRGGVNDIESSGKTTFPGFGNSMFGIMAADLQEPNSPLIVIGTNGRDSLIEHILGTVAEHVVRHAHCPVLVIPYIVE